MKKKSVWILILIAVAGLTFILFAKNKKSIVNLKLNVETVSEEALFTLKKGDILVRPNWPWLPGSSVITGGRRYGHVALVTEGASGTTIDETLRKATVVEALFFDQATRKFQFKKEDQIRERSAIISFGERFKNIRYRLRLDITDEQADEMVRFAENQLDGGYNLLSLKRKKRVQEEYKNEDWHCATLVWEAFYLTMKIDIDANNGIFIYPSDIIANPVFNHPGGRVRF
jgi:hypothetical protein